MSKRLYGFTPGKWRTLGAFHVVVVLGESDKANPPDRQPIRPIADIYVQRFDASMANARLIAAAPEMYRLLDDAAGVISQLNHGDPLVDTIDELLDEIDGKEETEDEQ